MKRKIARTGPFIIIDIDDTDDTYLKLRFSDGQIRALAKGDKWPPQFAKKLYAKAVMLKGKSVFIHTSQSTKEWDTEEWLFDIEEA